MRRSILFLAVLFVGGCAAQTRIITPATVLRKADGSDGGTLNFQKASGTTGLVIGLDLGTAEINADLLGGPLTVRGSSSTNGNLLFQPGNVSSNSSVFIETPRLDGPGLIVRDASGTTTANALELRKNDNTVYFRVVGGTNASLPGAVTSGGYFCQTAGACQIGSTSNFFTTTYSSNFDGAPVNGAAPHPTGNYVRTRQLDLVDSGGGTTLKWDMFSVVAAGSPPNTNYVQIRDQAGTPVLDMVRSFAGSNENNAFLDLNWLPDDNNTWDLGSNSLRWKKSWVVDLDVSGTCSGCGASPPFADGTNMMEATAIAWHNWVAASSTASDATTIRQRRSRGSIGTPSDVQANDVLGYWVFQGYKDSDWRNAAYVASTASSVGTNQVNGDLAFHVINGGVDTTGVRIQADGDTELAGHLFTTATSGTKDIGTSSAFFGTLYAYNVDAAPVVGAGPHPTGNYVRTRQLDLVDSGGGTTLKWDMLSVVSAGSPPNTNYVQVRDQAGAAVLDMVRSFAGSNENNAFMDMHWLPDDNNTHDLGSSSLRWKKGYVVDLDISGTCTGCPTGFWTRSGTTTYASNTGDNVVVGGTSGSGKFAVVGGDTFLGGHLRPGTDDTYDIGTSSSDNWDDLFVTDTFTQTLRSLLSTNITLHNTLVMSAHNTHDIGASGTRVANIYTVNGFASGSITVEGLLPATAANSDIGGSGNLFGDIWSATINNNNFKTTSAATDMNVQAHWVPWTNNTHDLGLSIARWRTLYAVDVNLSGALTTTGGAGLSQSVTVKGSDGNDCSLTFTDGVLTAETCP